jgi:hypothetical protein
MGRSKKHKKTQKEFKKSNNGKKQPKKPPWIENETIKRISSWESRAGHQI